MIKCRTPLILSFFGAILWTSESPSILKEDVLSQGAGLSREVHLHPRWAPGNVPWLQKSPLSLGHRNGIQGPAGLITQLHQLQKHSVPEGWCLQRTTVLSSSTRHPGIRCLQCFAALLIPHPPSPSPEFCGDSQKASEVILGGTSSLNSGRVS